MGSRQWKLRGQFKVENLPRAYLLYKSKCVRCPSNNFFKCTKQHAHQREIIGSAMDPAGHALSLCSRALRILIRASGKPQCTLWNQSFLVDEVRRRSRNYSMSPERRGNAVVAGASCPSTLLPAPARWRPLQASALPLLSQPRLVRAVRFAACVHVPPCGFV